MSFEGYDMFDFGSGLMEVEGVEEFMGPAKDVLGLELELAPTIFCDTPIS